MNQCEFDVMVDRRGSGAIKYDNMAEMGGTPDSIPMWIADMDFRTPDFILDALRTRLEHPVLGYTVQPPELWDVVGDWLEQLHGFRPKPEWMRFIPGIVKGIGMAINALVGKEEAVIIQPPVYHPFHLVPEAMGREVLYNPLIEDGDGIYRMDLEGLERIASLPNAKVLILCNPHNPGGTIWPREVLAEVANICTRHGVTVISDEIHADMALFGHKHTPFASVSPEAAQCSISFGAPSKTFNMAGVVASYTIVPSEELRRRFFGWMDACELASPCVFAPVAMMAAYRNGAEWRKRMLAYIEENVEYVHKFCAEHMPQIKPGRPQASFLMWLDCRELGLTQQELVDLFVHKAGLLLNDGAMFGQGGEGHMRLNVGHPRAQIHDALTRLQRALND